MTSSNWNLPIEASPEKLRPMPSKFKTPLSIPITKQGLRRMLSRYLLIVAGACALSALLTHRIKPGCNANVACVFRALQADSGKRATEL